ncbi:tRNA (N6-isopentenyl adenosine(37)-C2)-methylthiotransferase MiaB [Gammaproteobacteria bacterium]|nr:tRNA (N6-isopentenyl adenosine(37)-C2)-methylthiotransferase MiaB [Gammaproteobacteria bacterium]MDC0509096.1 tRNA (N6-isopentenyl adenosine(37)-C2)-methylthiotransferase MiaB [Gammaproteobacteria bacterium]MDC0577038.1 tRNA (N6-isopentenyl adenosine(37)-C2)-methylthiotransferase MiaB [Gammaproteobacteria bacterium]MDC0590824.1 tRNA (N6-isopentenyl adenosine(37)-C2)-methylthiotransferase MiaB [Gammaproteobacteria bacterium]
MAKKLFIKTHGCQMNEYDSNRMQDLLGISHGFETTDNEEEADLILLNTCSIREKAQEKVFHQLGRWKKLKDKNPNLKIGVGGCVASQEGDNIMKRAPQVDIVFGPQTIHRVPKLYENVAENKLESVDITFPKTEKFDHLPEQSSDGPTAFVSIMEGCNKYCSFCVVPHTRGNEISRPLDDILKEIEGLAGKGVKEVNLLGQNVNSYRDSKLKTKGLGLSNLIRSSSVIEGIERIQFTTSHPFEFGQDLIDIYQEVPQLISYVHLPVQSGSNDILKKMRRRHSRDEYFEIIDKLKSARSGISISSDFIVGFPGETEKDFLDTLDLVDYVGYDESFSFIYSPRPNTTAKDLEDDVPLGEKKVRLQELQHKLENSALSISRKMVGEIRKCLVTNISKKNPGEFQARADNNKVVIFSCSDPSMIGEIIDIEIVEARNKSLRGIAV